MFDKLAVITFENIMEAFCARTYLDNYPLPKYKAFLSVKHIASPPQLDETSLQIEF